MLTPDFDFLKTSRASHGPEATDLVAIAATLSGEIHSLQVYLRFSLGQRDRYLERLTRRSEGLRDMLGSLYGTERSHLPADELAVLGVLESVGVGSDFSDRLRENLSGDSHTDSFSIECQELSQRLEAYSGNILRRRA